MKYNQIAVFCTFFLLLSTVSLKAQTNYRIVGEVLTDNGELLPVGNAFVFSKDTTTMLKGDEIFDGRFTIGGITNPEIILVLKSFGQKNKFVSIDNSKGDTLIDLGQIKLDRGVDLDTIIVDFYIPVFESEGTSTIVNVDRTILSTSDSPTEILRKSPGLTVSNGTVNVIGKGPAAIYLDGQRITLEQLDAVPVSQIVKFEIIKDPSAMYDGDVAAVIKVYTRNYHYEGVSMNFRQSITLPTFMSNSAFGINYKKGKWSLNANYGFTIGELWNTKIESTKLEGLYETDLDLLEEVDIQGHVYSAGVGYELDSTSSVSFNYSGNLNAVDVFVTSENLITAGLDNSSYDALNYGDIGIMSNNFVANYRKSFDTLGSSLFVGAQYTLYELSLDDSIAESFSSEGVFQRLATRRIRSNNEINIISGQTDYEKMFKNQSSLSLGAKYSQAKSTGDLNMSNLEDGVWTPVSDFSSTTLFNEQVIAAYASYKKTIGSLSLSAGLRAEHTIAEGITTQTNEVSLDRTYTWLLPSVIISKTMNENVSVNLSYNVNTGRPSYSDLDPKVFYIDSLTSKQGNPLLLPQLDHSIAASLNAGPMRLEFNYIRSINAFKSIVREGLSGPNSVTLYRENIDADRFYISLLAPFRTKSGAISSYLYYFVGWDKVLGNIADFEEIKLAPYHYLYLYNNFKIKNWFNIELIGKANSGRFDGIYNDLPAFNISVGVSRTFLDDQLKVSVLGNDLFFTERTAGTYYIGDYSVDYLTKSYTQYVRFSLSYKFGRLQKDILKTEDVGGEERDRID
jgi:hypothetical protein